MNTRQAYRKALTAYRQCRWEISQGVSERKAQIKRIKVNNAIRSALDRHQSVKVLGASLITDMIIDAERRQKECEHESD